MKYIDLHCDALTKEREEQRLVTRQSLTDGGCLLQCFAAFVSARENRFAQFCSFADRFDKLCAENEFVPVRAFSDIRIDKICAMLTVEEGGAIEGDLGKLDYLYGRGVRMLTLLWNYPNELGFPNFPDYEGLFRGGSFRAREMRGLTAFGREVVIKMLKLGMICDLSHASDGTFSDVAEICKSRGEGFCVSHTGAACVLDCARNLTDKQIKTLADCGGVAGLYFCADFLSPDLSLEGQREAVLAHARAFLNAGGENVLCLGSDFDGIPPNAYIKDSSRMGALYEDFCKAFTSRVADKIFYENALSFLNRSL